MSENLIQSMEPRREWLLRCTNNDNRMAVCAVGVSDGQVEIYGPNDDLIGLNGSEIADFRTALDAAVEQAEADLRDKRVQREANRQVTGAQ